MNANSINRPHLILGRALKRKQSANSLYSQRAFARDLGVSSAFVTKLLTGQRTLPLNRFKKLARLLEMDSTEQDEYLQALIFHSLKSPELRALAQERTFTVPSKMGKYSRQEKRKFHVLEDWYNLAVLDLATCTGFNPDPRAIGRRLGITTLQASESLSCLVRIGLLKQVGDTYEKTDRDVFFPAARSQELIRNYHRQMIRKAYEALNKKSEEDYERRLITGFTIAANPEQLEKLKKMIFDFASEAGEQLSHGECSEVYQLNVQLFPLSEKAKK